MCLIFGQTPGEGAIEKVFVGGDEGDVRSQFRLGVSEQPGEEICLGGPGVKGNYVWWPAIVAISMGLGGAKKW